MGDRVRAEPLETAYDYAGESEWCRINAIDKASNVVRLCSNVPHASILDVGAGEGSVLGRLSDLGFGEAHTAVEVSETGLEAIRGRAIPSLVECGTLLQRRTTLLALSIALMRHHSDSPA